jgi:hypothetical protein
MSLLTLFVLPLALSVTHGLVQRITNRVIASSRTPIRVTSLLPRTQIDLRAEDLDFLEFDDAVIGERKPTSGLDAGATVDTRMRYRATTTLNVRFIGTDSNLDSVSELDESILKRGDKVFYSNHPHISIVSFHLPP